MTTVTVLSGPERRRRWSAAEKARIVEESFVAGATVAAVARRPDVHPNLLRYWRRQAKRVVDDGGVKLIPVAVSGSASATSRADGTIEIELGGGVRLRVDAAVDEAALGRVLRALGR